MEQKDAICKLISKTALALAGFIVISMAWANAASAQLIDERGGWKAQQQNRGSIASMIYQVENGTSSGSTTSSTSTDGVTQIVCGGATAEQSTAGATGNSSCVILNNSAGATVAIDQLSQGDQTATANGTTTISEQNTTDDDITNTTTISGNTTNISDAFDDMTESNTP